MLPYHTDIRTIPRQCWAYGNSGKAGLNFAFWLGIQTNDPEHLGHQLELFGANNAAR
jgi:hypothetical protein